MSGQGCVFDVGIETHAWPLSSYPLKDTFFCTACSTIGMHVCVCVTIVDLCVCVCVCVSDSECVCVHVSFRQLGPYLAPSAIDFLP